MTDIWLQQNVVIRGMLDQGLQSCPFLFHKFINSSTDRHITMNMESYQKSSHVLQEHYSLIAHLHCFDLEQFDLYYQNFLKTLFRRCSLIIVTFCKGNKDHFHHDNCDKMLYLHINNKGMDIGGKFNCIHYLHQRNITFKHILFLHSKTCNIRRAMYFQPLIQNLATIVESFKQNPEIGIYVPPLIHCGDDNNRIMLMNKYFPIRKQCSWNQGNDMYMTELDRFMELDTENRYFPEGNCFVCRHDIAWHLFGNLTLYECLNESDTLDVVWFYCCHLRKNQFAETSSIKTKKGLIDMVKQVSTQYPQLPKNNIDGGNYGHPDNMLEHCFERIIFKVAQKLDYKVYILPCSNKTRHIIKTKLYTRYLNTFMKKTI